MSSTENETVDTKERLLAVALELLRTEGVGALTIRRIAEGGGVSVSVVHHHYINKQGLLDACKLQFYADLSSLVTALIAESVGKPIEEVIEGAVSAMWKHVRANIPLARLLASEVAAEGQLIGELLSYESRPFLGAAVSALAPRLGLPPKVARLRVQALGVLVSRFAISADLELTSLFGVDVEEAANEAQQELTAIAKLLLIGTPAS